MRARGVAGRIGGEEWRGEIGRGIEYRGETVGRPPGSGLAGLADEVGRAGEARRGRIQGGISKVS